MSVTGGYADGDGRRVVAASAQGLAVWVVGEDGAVRAKLVDQGCCIVRAGQLRQAAVPASRSPGRACEQDGEGGQVRQDLVLADIGVLGRAGSGTTALV